MREAVSVYNAQAREIGMTENVFKSEEEHRAALHAKLADLAAEPPPRASAAAAAAAAAAVPAAAPVSRRGGRAPAAPGLQEQPCVQIPGLTGISRNRSGTYRVRITSCDKEKQHQTVLRTVASVKEAVDLYNARAGEWGMPLNVFKSEEEHREDLEDKLLAKKNTTGSATTASEGGGAAAGTPADTSSTHDHGDGDGDGGVTFWPHQSGGDGAGGERRVFRFSPTEEEGDFFPDEDDVDAVDPAPPARKIGRGGARAGAGRPKIAKAPPTTPPPAAAAAAAEAAAAAAAA